MSATKIFEEMIGGTELASKSNVIVPEVKKVLREKISTMPKFKKLFRGIKLQSKEKTEKNTIEKLLETTEVLEKKAAFLEKKIEDEELCAKSLGTSKKKHAIEALKRKKRFEKQLESVLGALNTMKFQLETLQSAKLNKIVLATMQSGAKEQKKAHKSISLSNVNNLLDDILDQKDLADELNNLFTGIKLNEDESEDALLAELEDIEKGEFEEKCLEISPPVNIIERKNPEKEKAVQKTKISNERDAIAKLEVWAETA